MYINKNLAVSETGFVFNPVSGDAFSTNPVGQEILKKLRTGMRKEALIQHIAKVFSADRSTIEKELTDFFLMLKNYQILGGHEQT